MFSAQNSLLNWRSNYELTSSAGGSGEDTTRDNDGDNGIGPGCDGQSVAAQSSEQSEGVRMDGRTKSLR